MENLVYYQLTFNYQLASDIQRRPLLKHRHGENSFLPLFSLAPQVMLCPLGKAVVVREVGVGMWRFLSAAHFFCSHVDPLHGPLKGVPVPVWAPPQAPVPSGVSLLQCGESPSKSAPPAAAKPVVLFSTHPCTFLTTLSHASSCTFLHFVATTGSFSLSQIN